MVAGAHDDDERPPAPLPAHERGWRHPSEVGHEAWVLSEQPVTLGRGLTATTGLIGVIIGIAVVWTMVPTHAGRTAVVSVHSTLSATGSIVVSDSLRAPDESTAETAPPETTTASTTQLTTTLVSRPPMPTFHVQATSTLSEGAVAISLSGSSLVITTAYAVAADNSVELLLTDGSTEMAQVLFVDHDSGLAVLTINSLPTSLALQLAKVSPGDELTLVGNTTYKFTIGTDGTFDQEFIYDDSVREGTPVMNQRGDLVGLCSNSKKEHFIALSDLAVVQRALIRWAGLESGDIVTAINQMPVADYTTFAAALAGVMPGDTVLLTVRYANGEEGAIEVVLGSPSAAATTTTTPAADAHA